jgi:hypothetical protein
MSACPIILPCIQAFAFERKLPVLVQPAAPVPQPRLVRQVAFYRKYTHAILRRYVRMSMEAGKVASPLNKEMFRGKVTSYKVESFEDVVVFLIDIDHCINMLDTHQQLLIRRISLEEFTVEETAALTRLNPRTVVRRYNLALDSLTRVFLHLKILEPQKRCQGAKSVDNTPTP